MQNLCYLVLKLTYDDFAGFHSLGDLVGAAHLRVADSSDNKNDETRAGPAFVLRAGFVLLTGTVEQRADNRKLKRIKWKLHVQILELNSKLERDGNG